MLGLFIVAGGAVLASYFYTRLRYKRFVQYAHIPQLPPSLLLGHLKAFGELARRGVPDRHPDKIFEEMWVSLGRPPLMLIDLRPVNPPMVLVPTHDIAEQISKPSQLYPYSTTKSPTWTHMIPIIGESSILGKEGSDWKDLRKRYNQGFSSQHLSELLPLIIKKMGPFCDYLEKFSSTGEEFSLQRLISNLTFDIIGAAVMEADLHAQNTDASKRSELVRLFGDLVETYSHDDNNLPWWLAPNTALKRLRLAKNIDKLIKKEIRLSYAEGKEEAEGNRSRSILALSFQDTPTLTPHLLSETSDQIRTFLFAGHDTNTSMMQWAIYELSRTPRALKARQIPPQSILSEGGQHLLPRMTYINAVIKETLRLHPPASTARMTAPGSGFTVKTSTGEQYLMDGLIMYLCASIIQRDPNVYGDTADEWVPERWIGEAGAKIPASAWRPFERGPRNCIGLELANLESRVILAVVARKYDFTKTGLGEPMLDSDGLPILDSNGQYKCRSEWYNTRKMTSKPVDGTTMRVKLATKA
ncbi:cytochrome P450 [Xylariaceae sp. FL0594]|nr:cytochrome P450 [Xylariaceae sp. FL0594]